ncbi:mei2-like protein [Fusarium globosum]|uniref:Mei2-like protein n=1 Tax=Fusarium globosum TaxID=78864 RepID=A0A8H5XQ16_9HYPO|nr:mei2-like protein [Fusarium globosum]
MVPENVVDGWDNDPLQEEPFPGPDNQSKMKRSVENAEHVCSPRLLGSTSAMSGGRASSFQPFGQRFKGKNTLVFYPEGSPTFAGALSQDMDISHRIEVCDTPAPSIVELGNYITIKSRSGTDHASPTHRTSKSPFSTSSPTHWIMLRNIPNKDGQPPSAQIVGASLGRPDCLFRLSEGTEHRIERSMDVMVAVRRSMYGADMLPRTTNFGVTPEEALELNKKQHGSVLKLVCLGLPGGCMMSSPFLWAVRFYVIVGEAEHIIYVIFSNTTNFGVTPEEARELHQSQKASDAAKVTAAPDGGGIWDGGASKDDPSNLI